MTKIPVTNAESLDIFNKMGGPAFPSEWKLPEGGSISCPGMTLLDWFAGQALAGMASISLEDGDMIMGWADMAKAAYRAADAMLDERAKAIEVQP